MVYGTVEPHTFLFQILFQGCLCCSLTAIHKTDILLTVMKYDAARLWIAFIQLVKDAWSHHAWDEVGRKTELLKTVVFHISVCITFHILVCIVVLGLFGIAVRTASLNVSNNMPVSRFFFIGRCQWLQFASWNQTEFHVTVSLHVLFIRESEDGILLRWVVIIFCHVEVEHIAIISCDGLISPILSIDRSQCYILATMLASAEFQQRSFLDRSQWQSIFTNLLSDGVFCIYLERTISKLIQSDKESVVRDTIEIVYL